MQQLLFIVLILLSLCSSAQITITQNDMPDAGNTFINTTALLDFTIDLGATGPNHSWDFSGVQPLNSTPDTFIDANDLPAIYSFFFLSSNLADNNGADISYNGFTIEDVYTVFKKTSSQFQLDGYAGTVYGIPFPLAYDTEDIVYRFPLNYGNLDSSDASVVYSIPGLIYFSQQRHRVNQVDGWGTVKTPIGTFDVLRVKSVITDLDSVYVDTLNLGYKITLKSYEYKWLAQDQGIPVFQMQAQEVLGAPVLTQINYQDTAFQTGTNNYESVFSLNVFPNPVARLLRIKGTQIQSSSICIYDSFGRIILKEVCSEPHFEAPVGDWIEGVYFIHVTRNEQSCSGKFLVKH